MIFHPIFISRLKKLNGKRGWLIMTWNIISLLLLGGLYMFYKRLPRGKIKIDYFQSDLDLLQEPNIPTF